MLYIKPKSTGKVRTKSSYSKSKTKVIKGLTNKDYAKLKKLKAILSSKL